MVKREKVNVIVIIINIFLFFLLMYSYALKEVSLYSIFPSLCSVYLVTHYWEKKLKNKKK